MLSAIGPQLAKGLLFAFGKFSSCTDSKRKILQMI